MELLNVDGKIIHTKKDATIKQVVFSALQAGKSLYKANLIGADLSNMDLSNIDLTEANFVGAKLTETDFTNTDLSWANLIGVDLTRANLTKAILIGTNLIGANLIEAKLTDANLNGANLTMTDFTRADLTRADLTRANLDFSSFPLSPGSLNMKIDERIGKQLMYHVLSLVKDLPECKSMITQEMLAYANGYHRVKESEIYDTRWVKLKGEEDGKDS